MGREPHLEGWLSMPQLTLQRLWGWTTTCSIVKKALASASVIFKAHHGGSKGIFHHRVLWTQIFISGSDGTNLSCCLVWWPQTHQFELKVESKKLLVTGESYLSRHEETQTLKGEDGENMPQEKAERSPVGLSAATLPPVDQEPQKDRHNHQEDEAEPILISTFSCITWIHFNGEQTSKFVWLTKMKQFCRMKFWDLDLIK